MKKQLVFFGIFFGLCSCVVHARMLTVENSNRRFTADIVLNGKTFASVKGGTTLNKDVPEEKLELKFSLAPDETSITVEKGTQNVCVKLVSGDTLQAQRVTCKK